MIREIVNDYREISANVDRLIKISGYKIGYIQKEMGIDNASFYYKRKKAKFTVDEIETLLDIINIEKMEDKVLGEISLESEKENETLSRKETKEILGWK